MIKVSTAQLGLSCCVVKRGIDRRRVALESSCDDISFNLFLSRVIELASRWIKDLYAAVLIWIVGCADDDPGVGIERAGQKRDSGRSDDSGRLNFCSDRTS